MNVITIEFSDVATVHLCYKKMFATSPIKTVDFELKIKLILFFYDINKAYYH